MPRRPGRSTTFDPHAAKRKRILRALEDPETKNLPSRAIARLCQVDERTVRAIRKELGYELPEKLWKFVTTPPKPAKVKKPTKRKGAK